MLYKFLSGLAKGVTHCIFRVKVVGKENVPKDGGMILAVNHKSSGIRFCRGILSASAKIYGKADLFKNKLFGGLIKNSVRFNTARQRRYRCYKRCVFNIKNNDAMLIFPEGHRIKTARE